MSQHAADGPGRAPSGADDQHRAIIAALRRYGTESTRLSQVFAARHRLQPVDIRALVAILDAENAGAPLTPGLLCRHLGLSSSGTSYVIDRLEEAGHVQRHRDDVRDNRVVHLRHTPEGMATASRFFGPLGQATGALMDRFAPEEIEVIGRFLDGAVEVLAGYVRAQAGGPGGPGDAGDPAEVAASR